MTPRARKPSLVSTSNAVLCVACRPAARARASMLLMTLRSRCWQPGRRPSRHVVRPRGRTTLILLRSPPSSSYRTLRSSFTDIVRPLVDRKNGDWSGVPAIVRPTVRAHCATPSAVITAMSSRPSSGSASSNTRTPANSAPTLPARMQLAEPLNQGLWSTLILAVNGGVRKLLAPVHRYAARPSRSFRPPSAPRIMSASNPAPAMTANRSPFILIASIRRRPPRSPVVTAPSMSPGMPRLVASRLAVPAGTIAIAASVPASTSTAPLRHAVASPDEERVGALTRAAV